MTHHGWVGVLTTSHSRKAESGKRPAVPISKRCQTNEGVRRRRGYVDTTLTPPGMQYGEKPSKAEKKTSLDMR
jgi:hypothetical protein